MEFARDKNGKIVHHTKARYGMNYECPFCFEKVLIRRGLNACFYHSPISDRTPLQRTCPEYHENSSYRKINDLLEILYINNGGIPLYLCNNRGRFELRAYFPQISERSLNKLRQAGAKIHVNTKAYYEIDKKVYSVDNLNFYPVSTIEKWIDVECEPFVADKETIRKWLSGIRGIDIEKDIYHSYSDGGYRVALKANITVGKVYQIMFEKKPHKIEGISFHKTGEIQLREKSVRRAINIYEMKIERITEPARQFIEGKGYKLVDSSNELLPLWPPGVFKGNEITFNERQVRFLHIKNSTKENLYHTYHNRLFEVSNTKENRNVVPININEDEGKSLAVSGEDDEGFSHEIKYNLMYRISLIEKKPIEQNLVIKDINDEVVDLGGDNPALPKDGQLLISSNVPFRATVSKGGYVISSSNRYLEDVGYNRTITIDSGAFGIIRYSFEENKSCKKVKEHLNWDQLYKMLYRCTGPTKKAESRFFQLLYLLSQNMDEINIHLYRLLETWIKTNSIPVAAINYVDEIIKAMGGMANE